MSEGLICKALWVLYFHFLCIYQSASPSVMLSIHWPVARHRRNRSWLRPGLPSSSRAPPVCSSPPPDWAPASRPATGSPPRRGWSRGPRSDSGPAAGGTGRCVCAPLRGNKMEDMNTPLSDNNQHFICRAECMRQGADILRICRAECMCRVWNDNSQMWPGQANNFIKVNKMLSITAWSASNFKRRILETTLYHTGHILHRESRRTHNWTGHTHTQDNSLAY